MVQPGQSFNEHISSLVGELVAASNEEVQGLVQVEIVVPGTKDSNSLNNTTNSQLPYSSEEKWFYNIRKGCCFSLCQCPHNSSVTRLMCANQMRYIIQQVVLDYMVPAALKWPGSLSQSGSVPYTSYPQYSSE